MAVIDGNIHPNKGGALTKHLNSATMDSAQIYGDGKHGSIGENSIIEAYETKVLIEAAYNMVFSQFGTTVNLALHSGKAISKDIFLPINDSRNINDQGIDANGVTIENGNLLGGNLDFNNLAGNAQALTEHGGRVNRVGVTKLKVTAAICRFGFFLEHTQEAWLFDNIKDLGMHSRREIIKAAAEVYELTLAQDLINGAGKIKYGGEALNKGSITGNIGEVISKITYEGLMKLDIELTNSRTPIDTTIVKGHRNTDTLTIPRARYAIIGSELIPTLERMKDVHGEKAFEHSHHYAAATKLAEGEIGRIGNFRFIINPYSGYFAGSGAAATNNAGYRTTGGKYDVFPMVVVGSGSFSTLGLRTSKLGTNGRTKNWAVKYRSPESLASTLDPYGETGLFVIKWYYSTLIERPERIAVYYTVAEI